MIKKIDNSGSINGLQLTVDKSIIRKIAAECCLPSKYAESILNRLHEILISDLASTGKCKFGHFNISAKKYITKAVPGVAYRISFNKDIKKAIHNELYRDTDNKIIDNKKTC